MPALIPSGKEPVKVVMPGITKKTYDVGILQINQLNLVYKLRII